MLQFGQNDKRFTICSPNARRSVMGGNNLVFLENLEWFYPLRC